MALEQVFECPRTLRRLRSDPLGKLLEGFCTWLLEHGFSRSTIRTHLFRLSHLTRHLGDPECGIRESITTRDVKASVKAYSLQCQKTGARENHIRRDYAIVHLLYTYGVRGGQVRTLQLEDIDWAHNQILFKASKGGKDSRLPLTAEVGESLLDYLQHSRSPSSSPQVFLTCRAPYHPLPYSSSLSAIGERRIQAAGIELRSKRAHAFRHGFATRMLHQGHSLKAVADVLGHRHLSTTFIYTKMDCNVLKHVALEWPQEVSR